MNTYLKSLCVALLSCVCTISCGEREIAAATDDKTSIQESKVATHATSCRVKDVPTDISNAICSADADVIRNALLELNAESRAIVAAAFAKLWMEQEEVGSSIPWESLRTQTAKMAYAPFLAQSVRNGRTDFPLTSLREFARDVALVENGTLADAEAIRVLGLADSAEDVPLLLDKIRHQPLPSEAGKAAILALGNICDPSATKALHQLGAGATEEEQKATIAKAVATRSELARDWCRSQ